MPKFRMKPVSCAGASAAVVQNLKQPTACVISSRLASHLSVVSAVMDGTHLNTSQLVCCLLGKVYLGTNLDFRPDHSLDVQLHALPPPPPFYALLSWLIPYANSSLLSRWLAHQKNFKRDLK